MIRFNDKSLIIEIPLREQETPLSVLSELQIGLIKIPYMINYDEAIPGEVSWSLNMVQKLLSEMAFDERQMDAITDALKKAPKCEEKFNLTV